MFRASVSRWPMLVALLCLVGCGEGKPDLYPVTGVVTLDGKPVEGANVSFSPSSEGAELAVGQTDASGKFTLTTPQIGEGATAGSYSVSITKSAGATKWEDPRASGGTLTEEQKKSIMDQARNAAKPVSPIPDKYANGQTSGFTADVKKDGENNFEFPMTSR